MGSFTVYQSLYSWLQPIEESTDEEELSIGLLEELLFDELLLEELDELEELELLFEELLLDELEELELLFEELDELELEELPVEVPFLAIPEGVVTSSGISLPKSSQAYSG